MTLETVKWWINGIILCASSPSNSIATVSLSVFSVVLFSIFMVFFYKLLAYISRESPFALLVFLLLMLSFLCWSVWSLYFKPYKTNAGEMLISKDISTVSCKYTDKRFGHTYKCKAKGIDGSAYIANLSGNLSNSSFEYNNKTGLLKIDTSPRIINRHNFNKFLTSFDESKSKTL